MNLTEQVSKAQVKNILAKLKAGKTITQREQKQIRDFEEGGRGDHLPQAEIAEHYGVSQPAVARWVKNGCPTTNFEAIDTWREQRRSAEPLTQSDAKLQKTLREVELLEVKIASAKGELVSREEMRETGQRVGALFVAELNALSNDVPGQLAGADEATIRERLESRFVVMVNRIREALAQIETVGLEK